ncbi:unnamed protein product [Durusdinium trenchii]|uniref:Uncharacterized protein n=2 Tax=Durusdinium trenchii TaxID=1381693 RepID=A0ABP0H9E1_9DINO
MAENRSRSPFPSLDEVQANNQRLLQTMDTLQASMKQQQETLHTHQGRINEIDQRPAHTQHQLQKEQQLQASKQALVTSWADSATAHDRLKAIEDLLRKEGLTSRYASTTTMKGKTGISPFTVVEFFTKEARNEFLDMIKKDMLICHGQITVGRAQTPKYQREADQPFRCAIATFSQCEGTRARHKPTRELSALWHSAEWVLMAEASPVDKTDIIIHVQPSTHEAFVSKFQADWQQWGGQKGQTSNTAAEYDEKCRQLQTAGKQTAQPMETDAANATPQTVSQPKGAGTGAARQ